MATKRKGKTVPCEGCRERKKKCTAGQPCERCKRLGIQCYYLKPVAPPKPENIESANHQEIQMHVEVLEDIMRNMERELYLLKSPFRVKQIAQHNETMRSSDTEYTTSDEDFDHHHQHRNRLNSTNTTTTATNRFFSQHEMTSNWQLKFRKDGRISINTDILSYANLLKHVEALGVLSETIPIIKQPTLASLSAGGGYLHRNVLYTVVRRGNFRAILGCIQNEARKQIISASTMTPPPSSQQYQPLLLEYDQLSASNGNTPSVVFEKKDLALQLVNAYFACRFLHRVVFHQKTFYDMFVKGRSDLEASPVVCAVSAAVLTMHCKHVMAFVPYDQQLGLGEYYFDKARYVVSLQFDEPSMETMITYLFMSLYKSNLLRPQDANMYLEIAIRIRQILAETAYKHPPLSPIYSSTLSPPNTFNSATITTATTATTTTNTTTNPINTDSTHTTTTNTILPKRPSKSKMMNRYLGEYEMFKRLHAGFQDCVQFIQFINNQRGIPVKNLSPSRNKPSMLNQENTSFKQRFQEICAEAYDPKPLPDESRLTVRAILKEHYVGCIARVVGPYFRRVRWNESDLIPLSFLMKTEEDLSQVYFHQIPLDFRLAPSIFEDGISDTEFRKRLLEDGRTDVNSVTIAARYYQSLLALHEPFQPTIRRSRKSAHNITLLVPENLEDFDFKKQKKRKMCSLATSSSSSSEEEGEEGENDDTHVLSVHALRAQEICYKCSITVVRLLEFQCTILGACTIPTPSLFCAWDTLMRNSCLGMDEQDLKASGVNDYLSAKDIELAREYAVRCIEVLRRGYLFNGAEREVFEYYEKIESQLLTALCKSASPTAKYWEPVSNW
ncbi:hypothetical protein MAM1_0005d00675 [Mucor ambiguus]|uniref:Zn(2)-C6 fungal-type domain-containing protein n=1 Tax=Mucor ambiguus TaxID=91626 RepID=A0A0C9MH30_9FUNG|nr:hypothetical protein MAM1_0005d00675 [Mucor ambiguus]